MQLRLILVHQPLIVPEPLCSNCVKRVPSMTTTWSSYHWRPVSKAWALKQWWIASSAACKLILNMRYYPNLLIPWLRLLLWLDSLKTNTPLLLNQFLPPFHLNALTQTLQAQPVYLPLLSLLPVFPPKIRCHLYFQPLPPNHLSKPHVTPILNTSVRLKRNCAETKVFVFTVMRNSLLSISAPINTYYCYKLRMMRILKWNQILLMSPLSVQTSHNPITTCL